MPPPLLRAIMTVTGCRAHCMAAVLNPMQGCGDYLLRESFAAATLSLS
jgi:hypothetical protein